MPQEDVITQLIFEDLKYHQFLDGLQELDILLEYYPDFPFMVARLLGIPFGQIPDQWLDKYASYMALSKACGYHDREALMRVATVCREALEEMEK